MELANIHIGIWLAFLGLVAVMLSLDLGVFQRKAHRIGPKEALSWCAVWISLALLFAGGLYLFWDKIQPGSRYTNSDAMVAFLGGYIVEYALSVDNIFVFLVVFSFFKVPEEYQRRLLFWGIIGAIGFRALFILLGVTLLEKFAWMMVLFGLFLVFTGIKLFLHKDRKVEPEKNPILRVIRKVLPVTPNFVDSKFFTRIDKRLWATPLFITLVFVELTDIVFAIDSIPAVFAITTNPFIVFTSNVFAILGLRSLFFAVNGLLGIFRYLSYGLAAILVFVGIKMIYGHAQDTLFTHWPKLPTALSLGVILSILAFVMILSLRKPTLKETTLAQ
jgi:tellurite resistance protein TerC